MAFRKSVAAPPPDPPTLTARMVGIGMNFDAEPEPHAPIEDTVVHASEAGMVEDDLRVLSVLTTWLGTHHGHVNADRLVRLVGEHPSQRVRAYWSAIAQWLAKDRRFARLVSSYDGPPVELLRVGSSFQMGRRGEDERFAGTLLRVPAGTLRDRAADVLTPRDLARHHAGYRNRVLMGPTWRADVWSALMLNPKLTPAETARQVGCAFSTAWEVVQDFTLYREVGAANRRRRN
jgi:hypothetical protein